IVSRDGHAAIAVARNAMHELSTFVIAKLDKNGGSVVDDICIN
ncbi:2576_t:CDS:1, partial [Acaulospora colombiana]